MPQIIPKDPEEYLDYTVDWSRWLRTGETIQTSIWIVPSGITGDNNTNTTTSATIWLNGGTEGKTYKVGNRITTNQGRKKKRSISIQMNEG